LDMLIQCTRWHMQIFVAIDQELSEEIEGDRTGGPSDGRVSVSNPL